jgi:predicted NBD/HSP70 family sugar kinase
MKTLSMRVKKVRSKMNLAVFDIGGTAVKYAYYTEEKLTKRGKFVTPSTWEEMQDELKRVFDSFPESQGVAISAPGNVQFDRGVIEGVSAVPYLHHFPIVDALEKLFGVPVVMENDANAAGLAEVGLGAAEGAKLATFLVIGSGLGGAIYLNGELIRGAHGYAGEFGYQFFYDDDGNWSKHGSPVTMAQSVSEQIGREVDGEQVYALAKAGDEIAQTAIDLQLDSLAKGLFNLTFTVDPDVMIIGGAISANPELLPAVTERLQERYRQVGALDLIPNLKTAQYGNEANLLGAVVAYKQRLG